MLVYTIIEHTYKGIQGVKTLLTEEEVKDHMEYLNYEFPDCKFEVLTSFCTTLVTSEELDD